MNIIRTENAPAAVGPYSQTVEAGALIFSSGQLPLDPATGTLVPGGIAEQTAQVLHNLASVLEAAGSGLDKVVKTTCYLKNLQDFPAFNEAYARFFSAGSAPARSCLEAAALPKNALVEIDVIALK